MILVNMNQVLAFSGSGLLVFVFGQHGGDIDSSETEAILQKIIDLSFNILVFHIIQTLYVRILKIINPGQSRGIHGLDCKCEL